MFTAAVCKEHQPADEVYRDVSDGRCYKKVFESGYFADSTCNLTVTPNTDGVPIFKSSGYSVWPIFICGSRGLKSQIIRVCRKSFLGAACGSPYIVFISTSGMLRSSDIYIYIDIYISIYIKYVIQCVIATMNLYYNLYYAKKRWPISNADNWK